MPTTSNVSGAGGSSGSGGGGGDASASNQVLALTALDSIYDALQLVGTEATSADILAAVTGLGDGATLADLATALAPLATEATQADILAALEAQGLNIASIKSSVDLLVPDLDAVRVAVEATNSKIPASPAQDRTTAAAPYATRIANAGGSGFITPFVSGDAVNLSQIGGTNFTLGAHAGIGSISVVPATDSVFPGTNAASSQADGHSVSIGATTDADTALTLIGRIKKLISLLPTALGAGGGLKIDGSGTALPTSNAASSQSDGHSASIGATTDAATATTVIGRLQKLISLLPTALVSGRLDTNTGSWLGSTAPTVGQKTANASIPAVLASDVGLPAGSNSIGSVTLGSSANWAGKIQIGDGTNSAACINSAALGTEYGAVVRVASMPTVTATVTGVAQETTLSTFSGKFVSAVTFNSIMSPVNATTLNVQCLGYTGSQFTPLLASATAGLQVQGATAINGARNGGLFMTGLFDSGSGVVRSQLGDFSGRAVVVETGLDAGSTSRTRTMTYGGHAGIFFDPSNLGPFGDLIAESKTAVISRSWRLNALIGQLDQAVSQTNGATVTIDTRRLRLRSGTTSGANATYQSVQIAQYREGQGFIFRWTTIFTTGVASSTQWLGWGNANDGIFVGYNGTSFSILHRISGSDSAVTAQASWNGDKVNGTGASGMTLDPTKGNVWAAHVPYLGYGDIRIFVMDSTTGQWLLVHTIRYANANTALEFGDPGFRLYGLVISSGSTTDLSAYVGSAAAFVVGKVVDRGQQWAENNTVLALNGTAAILSIRNATTVNSLTNTMPIRIRQITCGSDNGNTTTTFVAVIGTTLGGTPAFAVFTGKSGSTANNGVDLTSADTIGSVDKAGTTVTGGDPIWNTATSRNSPATLGDISQEDEELFIWPGQTLTVYATTGAASTVYAALNGTVG